ncbi:MAG: hypothetical protein CMO55_28750 [Verrucomicrobiales bacterium]|nr:hypothetical protein [Verrucomicrobiales bacterium]
MARDEESKTRSHRVAVVTGGSYGLGYAIAGNLIENGFRVVILARDEAKLRGAVQKLSGTEGAAMGIPCDVTDVKALESAASKVEETYGRIDFLIANAGSVHLGLLEEHSADVAMSDIGTGLTGTVLTVRSFLPFLKVGAKVLFIASGFGLMGAAGYTSYCAANAGIINFGEALRRELLCRDIAVYVACPSDIDTPGYRNEIEQLPGWMNQAEARGKPLQPEEAANRILSRCRGKRFLIIINPEIRMLLIAKKLLPERALLYLVDRLFPVPSREDLPSRDQGCSF